MVYFQAQPVPYINIGRTRTCQSTRPEGGRYSENRRWGCHPCRYGHSLIYLSEWFMLHHHCESRWVSYPLLLFFSFLTHKHIDARESNLKPRTALPETAAFGMDIEKLRVFKGAIDCEAPNEDLYHFIGIIILLYTRYPFSPNDILERDFSNFRCHRKGRARRGCGFGRGMSKEQVAVG